MPRVRKPGPELTAQDKQIVSGVAQMLRSIADRHNSGVLLGAAHLVDRFVDTPTPQPKPRTRKPKPVESAPVFRDGKTAAANDDTRELARHGA